MNLIERALKEAKEYKEKRDEIRSDRPHTMPEIFEFFRYSRSTRLPELVEELVAEIQRMGKVHRWNIELIKNGNLRVCQGEHEGDNCEYAEYVPADMYKKAVDACKVLLDDVESSRGYGGESDVPDWISFCRSVIKSYEEQA